MCEENSVQIAVQDGFERDALKVARDWFGRPIAAATFLTIDDALASLIQHVVEYAVIKVDNSCCTPLQVYLDHFSRYEVYIAGEYKVEHLSTGRKSYAEISYTQYFILSRTLANPVKELNSRTFISFTLTNLTDALCRVLTHFAAHDVDVHSIESRPTPVHTIKDADGCNVDMDSNKYVVCAEFRPATNELEVHSILAKLRTLSMDARVLGTYYTTRLAVDAVSNAVGRVDLPQSLSSPRRAQTKTFTSPLRICVIGFGNFGQFITKTFVRQGHVICCVDIHDRTVEAQTLGCEFHMLSDISALQHSDLDVIVFAVSILSFENVLAGLPHHLLCDKLVVDVLSVKVNYILYASTRYAQIHESFRCVDYLKVHAKELMLRKLPVSADILCTHPMFGPVSGKNGWQDLPFVFDRVRITNIPRCARFLALWESEGCSMMDMTCETHDLHAARTQFVTHLTGRTLGELNLVATPIDTRGFESLRNVVDSTCSDSYDLFLGLFHCNKYAPEQLIRLRNAIDLVEHKLGQRNT